MSEQQLRYDLLGAIKYRKRALNACKANTAIAVLDRYFDLSAKKHNKFYERILRHRKNFTLVVHGQWSNSHQFGAREYKRAIVRARRLSKLDVDFNRFYYSPFLEHRESPAKMIELFEDIRYVAPALNLINCHLKGSARIPAIISEVHGEDYDSRTSPYIWSSDGWDAMAIDVGELKETHKGAKMFGLWVPSFNGKKSLTDKTPPLERKEWPTKKEIRRVGRLYG